jgi:hypothetical protein
VFRVPILLVALLALILAACGGDQPAESPTPTPVATVEATPRPTPDPTPTDTGDPTDDGGSTGSGSTGRLADLLPERVGTLNRVDLPPGMESGLASVLGGQGLNADEADFVWAMWGDGGELMLTALSAPDMGEADLRMLAQMLSSAQTGGEMEVEADNVTVGGKDVLRMMPMGGGVDRTVYIYIGPGDAMFTVVAESEEHAAELLRQLP